MTSSGQTVDLLQVGEAGTGSLVIQNGGTLTQASGAAFTLIGTGSLTINGHGSTYTTPNDLILGRGTGTNAITVENGGQLYTGNAFIGEGTSSVSTDISATVTGAGSYWNAGEFIGVGGGPNAATLTISDGATVTAQSTVAIESIGSGATGIATVTGPGSQLLLPGTALAVGEYINGGEGNGTLTISNGGLVSAQTVTLGEFDAGTTGVLNLDGTSSARGVLVTTSLAKDLGSGTVNFNGGILRAGAASSNFISGFSAGNLVVDTGGLYLDTNGFDVTITDGLSGSGGLTKIGNGTLVLNSENPMTGNSEVSAGTLEVGDSSNSNAVLGGNLSVDQAAVLLGYGTIAGNLINNGTVIPGGAPGTIASLSVGGNYKQASTATLSIEVSPMSASQLKVNGSATLHGVLAITYDPGTYTATQYTIVSAANGVTGKFSSTTSTLSGGANLGTLQSSVTYGANNANLVLANASTTTTAPVVVAPNDTSIYAALGTAAVMNAQGTTAALLDRSGSNPASPGAPAGWIRAMGEQTNVGGSNGEPGVQANQYGFLAGLEQRLGDYTLGVAGGYTHTNLDEQVTGDSGVTDTLRAALYASRWLGPVGVSGTLGYGLDFLSQKRPFAGVGTAAGDHMGQEFATGAQASLPLTLGSVVLTPRVGLRYAYFHATGFGESGAAAQDLAVSTDNVHSLQPYAELTLDKAFGDALKPVNVQLRVGYAREVLNAGRAVSVASQDGTLFTAPGTSLPRGYLTTGISIGMQPVKDLAVSLGYDTLINTTHASAQAGTVRADYRF
ncbi:autotransporter outer membrane beta-barrel domain-containing protein [Paraburkholderia aspalathi]|uniref:autotransporter outer membrane beta-barrel domain-containing protein n=1 Tax=Paraburkholderia aspalathi TaxID=1324617 RepID=UPI00190A0843|nr:autotransporter outer membrane beta-barrel domain-containing protein [Paraburkholderia aspalathi]MBK3824082.1 autotransporter domain-containing protein [Paraburkholderia aspalathi]MBK3835924.1 autotransporter domain-containing protein [Paraburkholderia aspalathi]MBK3865702.1 autotransporter domain-containing protein [Paraburkholderia aspalathi]